MRKSQLYSIAFGCSLLVLLTFSLLLYNSINSLRENSSMVEHSEIVIDKLQNLNLAMMDVETSQRGYLLTKDASFLDLLISSRDTIPILLDSLQSLVSDNPDQTASTSELKKKIVARLQRVQEVLNRVRIVDGPAINVELNEGKLMMDEFRHVIGKMQRAELVLMDNREKSKQAYEKLTPNYFKAILSITTVIAFISFFLLLKELRQRLATQALLETRVNSLAQTNAELQQIAHITSHDLQEPLRKIRTFVDALQSKFVNEIPDEGKAMLERVDKNANYIRELVADLSDFASLAYQNDEARLSDIDLNKLLLETQKEIEHLVKEKEAVIVVSPLPRISGYQRQLTILFKELIVNALKFSKDSVAPHITITGNLVNRKQDPRFGERTFSVITIYDNGIGFEPAYAHKIFILFQKLHGNNSLYKGKGIGLAICQRIMANHYGFITAEGVEGEGATFQLYFPT